MWIYDHHPRSQEDATSWDDDVWVHMLPFISVDKTVFTKWYHEWYTRYDNTSYLTRTDKAPRGVTRVAGAKAYAAKFAPSPVITAMNKNHCVHFFVGSKATTSLFTHTQICQANMLQMQEYDTKMHRDLNLFLSICNVSNLQNVLSSYLLGPVYLRAQNYNCHKQTDPTVTRQIRHWISNISPCQTNGGFHKNLITGPQLCSYFLPKIT